MVSKNELKERIRNLRELNQEETERYVKTSREKNIEKLEHLLKVR